MNAYHFTTRWLVGAGREEVYRLLEEVELLPVWWPSVYLDLRILEQGKPGGIGKVVELYTKGWLPYTLQWKFRVTEADFPNGFALEAFGDLVGSGVWTFKEMEDHSCEVIYDWKINAEKPLLRFFTPVLRPLFSANHLWAMRMGEKSLRLELRRRRAGTPDELAGIPAPPPPTFPHNLLKNRKW